MVRLPRLLHDDTVTIVSVSSGPPDDNGIPTTTTTETVWAGVNVQQASADELNDYQQETNTTYYRVSGSPPPVDIDAGDHIRWRGEEYEIDGKPDTRRGRYRIEHTALMMYETEG